MFIYNLINERANDVGIKEQIWGRAEKEALRYDSYLGM